MQHQLLHELTHHEYLRQELEKRFPDTDEETLLGTLEGLTNLNEMLAAVVRSQLDDVALATGLRGRMDDMRQRLTRLDERVHRKREILTTVMDRARIKKLTEPDFTVSLRQTERPLVFADETQIPDRFWKPQPAKLDRKGLLMAHKAGQDVPGSVLGNGGVTISVRTR